MWTVLGSIFLSENTELFVNDDQGLFLNAGDRWGGVLPKYDSLNPPNTMLCISWLQICRQYNLSAIKKNMYRRYSRRNYSQLYNQEEEGEKSWRIPNHSYN